MLVYTDNSALSYLQKNPKPSPRQVRWLEKLQRYDLKICHILGRSNVTADALSRYPVEGDAKGWGSELSVIKRWEDACEFVEEPEGGPHRC